MLIIQVPRKPVVLGKDAGFGPDIVYHDNLMLKNFTRMQEIHMNWQELFPSELNASFRRNEGIYKSPEGRGYVHVNQDDDFDIIHPPFKMDDAIVDGDHYEGYIMSVYHQLHCLVSSI